MQVPAVEPDAVVAPMSRSRLVLACLPLLAALVWPRAYGPSLQVTPYLMGLGAVAWLSLWLRPNLPLRPVGWLLLVVAVIWISPWTQILQVWAVIAAAMAAWLCIAIGQSLIIRPDLMRALVTTLIIAALVHVAVAWLQFFHVERTLYPLVSLNDSARPYGNLRQPNHLATLCVVAWACVWWASRQGMLTKWVVIALSMLILSGVVLSASRVGWLALIVLSFFLAVWADPSGRFNRLFFGMASLWAFGMSLGVQALLMNVGGEGTLVTARDLSSVSARLEHWKAAWNLAIRHPTLGVGWGEFRYARFMEEPIVTGAEIADNAHNLVMHLLAELGFTGAFLVLAPVAWLLLTRQPWHVARLPTVRWGWLVILAIGLHSLLEYPLWYLNFLTPTALAFGVILATSKPLQVPERTQTQGLAVAILSVAILTGVCLAGYDYARVVAAFKEDGRSVNDPVALAKLQSTWLFSRYADEVLVQRVQVTQSNAASMWTLAQRQMHVGPGPYILWSGLAAQCQMGGGVMARELAKRFEAAFPEPYREFKSLTSPTLRVTCLGL